jgi:hypothetical protein
MRVQKKLYYRNLSPDLGTKLYQGIYTTVIKLFHYIRLTLTFLGGEWSGIGPFIGPIGETGYWWSATEDNLNSAVSYHIYCNDLVIMNYPFDKRNGLSVRCIKD